MPSNSTTNGNADKNLLPINDKRALEILARSINLNNPAQMHNNLQLIIVHAQSMIDYYCQDFADRQADPLTEIDRLRESLREALPEPDPTPHELWSRLL